MNILNGKGNTLKSIPFFYSYERMYMIKKYFILMLLLIAMESKTVFGFSGGPPAERTGSPAEICGDDTCASSCHTSFPVNSGTANFSINLSSPDYKPGQILDVTIAFNDTLTAIHGFEVTAVDPSNKSVGSFAGKDEMTQTEAYDNLYAAHTKIGTAGNQWTVQWTAPSTKVSGPITFYAAGNEADGNGSGSGDYIYTATATLSLAENCVPSRLMAKPKKLVMKRGAKRNITVTVKSKNNEFCSNYTVSASAAKGRVHIAGSMETDKSGKARFIVTAGDEAGKDTITFRVQDSDTILTKNMKVKIQ